MQVARKLERKIVSRLHTGFPRHTQLRRCSGSHRRRLKATLIAPAGVRAFFLKMYRIWHPLHVSVWKCMRQNLFLFNRTYTRTFALIAGAITATFNTNKRIEQCGDAPSDTLEQTRPMSLRTSQFHCERKWWWSCCASERCLTPADQPKFHSVFDVRYRKSNLSVFLPRWIKNTRWWKRAFEGSS